MNRIIEQYGAEMERICRQTEELLERTKAERRYSALEYITLLNLTELVEILRMDMGRPRFISRAGELAGRRNCYRLPLLNTEEYILIRNLLENHYSADGQKAGETAALLDRIRKETRTITSPDGSGMPAGSRPSESVFQQYYEDVLKRECQ